MTAHITPVTLEGDHVELEPLTRSHVDALRHAAADGQLWRLWFTGVPEPEATSAYVDKALAMRADGTGLPFAVRLKRSGEVVGCTRYCHASAGDRRLEVGYTWYARSVQRSAVNTECKRLLLGHAFETLGCIRVEFRTHWLNHRSRAAIERLGAKQEGVLRSHRVLADGSRRDTVVYAVIDHEWPAVKRHLDFHLERNNLS